jgi:hypothetical protein
MHTGVSADFDHESEQYASRCPFDPLYSVYLLAHRIRLDLKLPRAVLRASVKVRDHLSHPLRRDSGRSSNRHLSAPVNTSRLVTYLDRDMEFVWTPSIWTK